MMKTKIPELSYNAMFKAVFSNHKSVLTKMIEAILSYCNFDVDLKDKELIVRNNELPVEHFKDRQLICDYIIQLDENSDLNIEINRSFYPRLMERNMTYSFKIYYEHFKSGDTNKMFQKYSLLQVNFNRFSNPNEKTINQFFLIDAEDLTNYLSKNLRIVNIDIASCFQLVYNNDKLQEISSLERFSACLYCQYLEDISVILGSDLLGMEEKKQFLDGIQEISKDKELVESMKLEDSLDYRFDLVREDAEKRGIEQGISQGIEQTTIQIIQSMLKHGDDLEYISEITGKTVDEIKEIEQSMKD